MLFRFVVTLIDGRVLEQHVERVVGSAENPMSDRDLETKVRGLGDGVLPAARIDELIALIWRAEELTDAAALARAAAL